jgi:hypothetical protein
MTNNSGSMDASCHGAEQNLAVIKYDNKNPLVIILDNLAFSGGL